MKRSIAGIILAAAAAVFSVTASADNADGISVSADTLTAGEFFTLTVNIPPSENADTASVKITYDETAFEVTEWAPALPGGVSNSGNGILALSAANIERVIDLSGGLTLTAEMRVRDDASPGAYTFELTDHSLCYVQDNGYEFEELWFPEVISAAVEVVLPAAETPETVISTAAAAESTPAGTAAATVSTDSAPGSTIFGDPVLIAVSAVLAAAVAGVCVWALKRRK